MKILKSTKSRILLPVIGGLTLVGLGGMALAKPAPGPGADGKRGGMCAKLECTDTQKEELRAVMSELRSDSKGDREAIKRLRKQLSAEFAKDKPDEAAMRRIQAQIATHHQELHDRGFDAIMEVHGMLDSQQRATLATVMEHRGMRGLMGGKKGRHGKKGKKGKRGGKAERGEAE